MAGMFAHEKWRRIGYISILLTSICGISLLVCLLVSLSKHNTGSLSASTIIFEGSCDDSRNLNIALHLLINVVSTAVLASSNFFMQVLNSPTRLEIDKAHSSLKSLDIGIPSIKNIRFLSGFKLLCWLVLFVTSIPIHLLFNSAIFKTTFVGGDWNLTIASEAFLEGVPFFEPGASLAAGGVSSPSQHYGAIGYGSYGEIDLEKTARDASTWETIDAKACLAGYGSCTSRNKYRDVVVVVDTGAKDPAGWTRSEVFDFQPYTNFSDVWDKRVPKNETNSLWYSTSCGVSRAQLASNQVNSDCHNGWAGALGLDISKTMSPEAPLPSESNWRLVFHQSEDLNMEEVAMGYNHKFDAFNVRSCRVKEASVRCNIGLSNALPLAVSACIFVKVLQCTILVLLLAHTSLVTPGDAIESFISEPDPRTVGLGTFGYLDSLRLEYSPRVVFDLSEDNTPLTLEIHPRQWQSQSRRLMSIIPRSVWSRTYSLILLSIGFMCMCLALSIIGIENSL